MNIVIVGCGKVGRALALRLCKEKDNDKENEITVIDLDEEIASEINDNNQIRGISGNGATQDVLLAAGVDRAQLFIAVTGSDELNLLCCIIARKVGGCQTIARVRNPDYSRETDHLQKTLGLAAVINPELEAARAIARVLRFPSAKKIDIFSTKRVELVTFELAAGSALSDRKLSEIKEISQRNVLVCTVQRKDSVEIPNGEFVFRDNDTISLIAEQNEINRFFKDIGCKMKNVRNAMIAGGGKISYYLCDELKRYNIMPKIIENNEGRSEWLAQMLDNIIIRGDAADTDLLDKEHIEENDAFVALTNFDEENILLSLYAQKMGVSKVITKINRVDFGDVITDLRLDTIINPRNITSDYIVRYVRSMKHKNRSGSKMEAYYSIIEGKAEAAEFRVNENSALVGKSLQEIGPKLKHGILVAAIIRGRETIIPHGNDVIAVSDSVVIVSKSEQTVLLDIDDILR